MIHFQGISLYKEKGKDNFLQAIQEFTSTGSSQQQYLQNKTKQKAIFKKDK